ncbi:response regulator [Ciceribacter selenitireducens]
MTISPADPTPEFRVLVVEDELFIAMDIADVLASAGFEVLGPAASIDDAFRLLGDVRPDAAVLDVNLGGDRVTPVAAYLKSQEIPFVLASAGDPQDLTYEAAFAGVENIGKPSDMSRLVATMQGLKS